MLFDVYFVFLLILTDLSFACIVANVFSVFCRSTFVLVHSVGIALTSWSGLGMLLFSGYLLLCLPTCLATVVGLALLGEGKYLTFLLI